MEPLVYLIKILKVSAAFLGMMWGEVEPEMEWVANMALGRKEVR